MGYVFFYFGHYEGYYRAESDAVHTGKRVLKIVRNTILKTINVTELCAENLILNHTDT